MADMAEVRQWWRRQWGPGRKCERRDGKWEVKFKEYGSMEGTEEG